MIMAMAVATCRPTMNARYGEPGADTSRSRAQEPPITAGNRMEWPRLDTGTNSATPSIAPTQAASSQLRCADTGGPLVRDRSTHASDAQANDAPGRPPVPGGPPSSPVRSLCGDGKG